MPNGVELEIIVYIQKMLWIFKSHYSEIMQKEIV